jgi:hypothetical protein
MTLDRCRIVRSRELNSLAEQRRSDARTSITAVDGETRHPPGCGIHGEHARERRVADDAGKA